MDRHTDKRIRTEVTAMVARLMNHEYKEWRTLPYSFRFLVVRSCLNAVLDVYYNVHCLKDLPPDLRLQVMVLPDVTDMEV